MSDTVNHPKHYITRSIHCDHCNNLIEAIVVTEEFSGNLSNAIKYIWRCDYKDNKIEDIKKAIWYLNRELYRLDKKETVANLSDGN